jgi:membrane protease YdiL (CAAX protease family)
MFTGAALLFSWIYYKSEWGSYFTLDKEPKLKALALWGMLILSSYPFLGGLAKWNEMIPFPEWMLSNQDSTFEIMGIALTMESFYEVFQGIILVGLMAGLGEELVFRGIVQKNLNQVFSSPHAAIWIAALIFGGFHMQAERFLPLSFLGLLLGYSYYYTKTLLVPILLHLLNNSVQILSLYILKLDPTEELTGSEDIPMIAIICSGLLTFALFYYLGPRQALADESRP